MINGTVIFGLMDSSLFWKRSSKNRRLGLHRAAARRERRLCAAKGIQSRRPLYAAVWDWPNGNSYDVFYNPIYLNDSSKYRFQLLQVNHVRAIAQRLIGTIVYLHE